MFLGRTTALLFSLGLVTQWSVSANFVAGYLAQRAYQKQDFGTAESYHQAQVQTNHQDSTALYNLGASAYQNKNYQVARQCFEQVGATDSLTTKKRAAAYFNAGNSSVQLNELEQALALYQTGLKFDPQDQKLKNNYEKLKQLLAQQKNQPEQKNNSKQDQDQSRSDNSKQAQNKLPSDNSDQAGDQTKEPDKSDGSGDSESSAGDQDSSSSPKPDAKAGEQKAGPKNNSQDNTQAKNSAKNGGDGSKSPAKDQTSLPDQSAAQAPADSAQNLSANPDHTKREPADGSKSQAPTGASGEDQDGAAAKPLDPKLAQLLQAAQTSDRAANKQIMQYQLQQGQREAPAQTNNW